MQATVNKQVTPDPPSRCQVLVTLFLASRPKFLTASAAPVLVGTALGYAAAGSLQLHLFILAALAIMALHAGANIANDYFDHLSRNDWLNTNVTPFSGGRRFIQQGVMSPGATLLASLFFLTLGCAVGCVILLLTGSVFILLLGLVGLVGGFFYTAPPVKLGYRGVGEIIIGILFGLLPVYGSYYLQAQVIDITPLIPGLIVAILILLVILINEFPDREADAAVDKKTLVVVFGIPCCTWIYRIALIATYFLAAAYTLIHKPFLWAGVIYLLTLPVAIVAVKFANSSDLAKPSKTQHRASAVTILLHLLGSVAMAAGFVISALSG